MNVPCVPFLMMIVLYSQAQIANGTESSDSTNIYRQALKIYLHNSVSHDKSLIIEKNSIITDKLPIKIESYSLSYVDRYEIENLLKKVKEITVVRIIALRVKDGDFFINIIPFQVTKQKANLTYTNAGGDQIIFTFDSPTKRFLFKEIKRGNI